MSEKKSKYILRNKYVWKKWNKRMLSFDKPLPLPQAVNQIATQSALAASSQLGRLFRLLAGND